MPVSSSQPIREELVQLEERALELIAGQKSFVPPAQADGESDADRAKFLKKHLRTLSYELTDVIDVHSQIQACHHRWITAREKMTGNERVDDNPV
jgi:hypothetical protein